LIEGEALFELDARSQRFFVELDGQFIADEIILKNTPCAFLESCPRFCLERISLCHNKIYMK